MKKFVAIILLAGLSLQVYAQAPTFETGEFIYDGVAALNVGLYGSPFIYEWNGDGKKDLIVGQFDQGNIRFYENTAEHNDPLFDGFEFLQADGAVINLPYG